MDDESDTEDEISNKKSSTSKDDKTRQRCGSSNSSSSSSSSSSAESLTGEYPRGYKRAREKSASRNSEEKEVDESSNDEFPSTKFRRGEQLGSDLDIGQDSNSEGSVEPPDEVDDGEWNMMGAALEREFLSNN